MLWKTCVCFHSVLWALAGCCQVPWSYLWESQAASAFPLRASIPVTITPVYWSLFFLVIRQPTCFGNPGFMVQEPLKARPVCSSLIWEKHFHCLWVGKLQLLHLSYCFPFQKFCEGTEQKDNYLFRYCARSIYWGVWMWSVMFWRYRTGSNHNSWSWD